MAICKRCQPKVKEFLKKFDKWLLENVTVAVRVVGVIKTVIDNPVVDIITSAIPGDLDDRVKVKLRESIAFALQQLVTADECNKKETVELKLQCYVGWLATLPATLRNAHLFKFASLVTRNLDELRHNEYEYDTAVQLYYAANKN
jgi:hypothetical protein